MKKLILSENERATRRLEQSTLDTAVEQVKTNGFVVFEKVIDSTLIQEIRNSFDPLFDEYVAKKGYNTGTNRAQMHLPFVQPFIHEDIFAHPIVMSIVEGVLGDAFRCTYFASDTPMPGSDYQAVHCDAMPLFPEVSVSIPSYALVLNIPLVDVTEENGPLEIWPGGTHMNPEWAVHDTLDGSVNPHLDIVRAAEYMTSEKVYMSAGSMVIRDLRVWHRGTPNRSQDRRTNLAFIYGRRWWGGGGSIHIPQETYDGLSPQAKALFRKEKIGAPAKLPWEW